MQQALSDYDSDYKHSYHCWHQSLYSGKYEYIGDAEAPTHRVWGRDCDFPPSGTPMHNPYGCWRLELLDSKDD